MADENPTALAAAQKLLKWQPIETAPKDGSAILVGGCSEAGGEWRQAVVTWRMDEGRYWKPEWWWFLTEDGAQSISSAIFFAPTHWMPLPPKPIIGAESDSATDLTKHAQEPKTLVGSMEVPGELSPSGERYSVPVYAAGYYGASLSIGREQPFPMRTTAIFSREVSPAELAVVYEAMKDGPVGEAIAAAEAERAALAKKIVEILRDRFEPLSEVVISETTLEQCADEILSLLDAAED